jgi:hypothetical protein
MCRTRAVPLLLPIVFLLMAPLSFADEQPAGNTGPDLQAQVGVLRQQMDDQRKAYDNKLQAMQQKLDALYAARAAGYDPIGAPSGGNDLAAALAAAQSGSATQPLLLQGTSRSLQSSNPDISLVGDFVAHYDSRGKKVDLQNEFLVRELELSFISYVDPYAKATVIISLGQDPRTHEFSPDVEEAYLTLLTLPWDLQAKVGKFRADFGKANPAHLHALPWVEYPLVIRNFFGEEGLTGEGVSVSRLVPNPWNHYIELTAEFFDNDNATMFAGEQARSFTQLVHARDVITLSQASTLEVGLSAASGANNRGDGSHSTVEGADITYKWRPPQEGLYKSFLFQNEFLSSQKETACGMQNAWGMYSAAEYQLTERLFAGARYDFSQMPDNPIQHETDLSAYLTFKESEFCFWRLGLQHDMRNFCLDGNMTDNQLWLQLNYTIGVHPAHSY